MNALHEAIVTSDLLIIVNIKCIIDIIQFSTGELDDIGLIV